MEFGLYTQFIQMIQMNCITDLKERGVWGE